MLLISKSARVLANHNTLGYAQNFEAATRDMNRRVFVAEGGQPRYRLWDPPEAITRQKGP